MATCTRIRYTKESSFGKSFLPLHINKRNINLFTNKTTHKNMMKKYLFAMALAAMSTAAFAQTKATEWNSFYVQYNPMKLVVDRSGYDDWDFTGFTIGFDKAISVAGETPLYITVGGALNAAFHTDSAGDEEYNHTFISAKVPASLTYKWQVSDAVSILPYAGLYARFNVIGTEKHDDGYDDETISLFNKKDMGSSDATWKRLQLGYQVGVNVMFNNKWHLGLAYASDFSEVAKKLKFSTPAIVLGFDF